MDEGKPPIPPAGAPEARLQARFDSPDLQPIADHLVNIAEQLRMLKLNGSTEAPSLPPNQGTMARAVPALKGGVSPIEIARYTYLMRRTRNAIFGSPDMFGEPAWDIPLDLYIAYAENKPVSVSSACIGSASPPTTGLRWLGVLADKYRSGTPPKFTAEQLTALIALACERPEALGLPVNRPTPAELAREAVKRGIVESISPRHLDRILKRG